MRTLFLHIQKTGGTSVVAHLRRVLRPRKALTELQFAAVPPSQLKEYDFISGHFGFEYISGLMDSSYSFTLLRDPVQRVLSLYNYCKEAAGFERASGFPVFESARRMTFDEFVRCEDPASGVPASIDNVQTRQLAWHYSARQWESAAAPPDRDLLERAVTNLDRFSHVGLQENLLAHLGCILLELGYSAPQATFQHNKSTGRLEDEVLQPGTLARLRDRLRLDLALYDHARAEYALS